MPTAARSRNYHEFAVSCHTLQALHMISSKPRLLLFTVPHSWLLSLPNKMCTQPMLADAQHCFAICAQIWLQLGRTDMDIYFMTQRLREEPTTCNTSLLSLELQE